MSLRWGMEEEEEEEEEDEEERNCAMSHGC